MKVEIDSHDHRLKNIEQTFRDVNALVQEQIGLVIAESGWQSTEEQITKPILIVSLGALQSLDISTLSHQKAHTQRFLAVSGFSLDT